MELHRRDYSILSFLQECNKVHLEKKILDCGAGGPTPPLAIFFEEGYETHGIEILESRIDQASKFAKEHKMNLNIIQGDMRKLPYEDEAFSYVFSHHTVNHLVKTDIKRSMKEMERVLKPNGLIYVNFPSVNCASFDSSIDTSKGELIKLQGGNEIIHCFFKDYEADSYFGNFTIISKNKWKLMINKGWFDNISMIDYIAQKK